jgi:hypothetical protein
LHRLFTLQWQDSPRMEINFPHRDRHRLSPLSDQPIDFAALVATLVAAQAVSTTARAEEVAAQPPSNPGQAHDALLRIFAPRRSERRTSIAVLAGSFHRATARALASIPRQPE